LFFFVVCLRTQIVEDGFMSRSTAKRGFGLRHEGLA
jgi:hypothetical protein